MEGRLLERIMRAEEDRKMGAEDVFAARLASISSYLGRILNTRQGSSPATPDLGMPDITDLVRSFGGEQIRDIEEAIATTIARFEPRLRDVRVSHRPEADSAFVLTFELSARVESSNGLTPVFFETLLLPDGRIEVKGYA